MKIKLIKNDKDYEKTLRRLEKIFDASPKSKEGDEAEMLSLLIENYEEKYYPIEVFKSRIKKRD